MTEKAEWLARLKVGDEVAVRWLHRRLRGQRLQKVAMLTDNRIITDDNLRYQRIDGQRPGNSGAYSQWIENPTAAQARRTKR